MLNPPGNPDDTDAASDAATESDAPPSPLTPHRALAAAVFLLAATLVAYGPALRGGFVWDDFDYVADNPALRSLDGLRAVWFHPGWGEKHRPGAVRQYYPLVYTSFWVEHHLWADHTLGYHLVNVVLHAGAAWLAWLLLRRLRVPGAFVAAAVFALHPVHVESVAWITERKNVLSAVFALLALLAYLRFDDLRRAADDGPPGRPWRWYAAAVALFLAALLSKTTAAALPAVLLLLLWWKRRRLRPADWFPVVPLFLLAAAMGTLTLWTETRVVGTAEIAQRLAPAERLFVAGRALWFYAAKLAWPHPLIFIYPRWDVSVADRLQAVYPVAAVAAVILLWMLRPRLGKGPLVAALVFGGALVPALGFFDVYFQMAYTYVADHFVYLSSLALIALAVASGAALLTRLGSPGRRLAPVAAALVLLALGALTWRQAHAWTDEETLWRDTVAKNPEAWMAHLNLGSRLAMRRELDDAEEAYRQCLRVRPGQPLAHYGLAKVCAWREDFQDAVYHFNRAVDSSPDFTDAHYELARALQRLGRVHDAVRHYRQAIRIDFRHTPAHYALAGLLEGQGDLAGALDHYAAALQHAPDFAPARFALGRVTLAQGRARQAVAHFREALALRPDWPEVLNALAWIHATSPDPDLRDGPRAVELAERASRLADNRAPAVLDTLAAAYAEVGRWDRAVETAERAAQLADEAGRTPLADEVRDRLALYRAQKPYRTPTP